MEAGAGNSPWVETEKVFTKFIRCIKYLLLHGHKPSHASAEQKIEK